MRLEALLRAHGFMKVERPPEIWEADTDDYPFVILLGEMIAAGLVGGAALADLTLSVANVVVEPDEAADEGDGHQPLPGEYVAITVGGQTDFGRDAMWHPGGDSPSHLLTRLTERLEAAGARWAYIRHTPPTGSFTVFVPRLAAAWTGARLS